MTTPYTYIIYCKPTQQTYYGVRYAKDCDPSDLWLSYFTSSSYVRELIKLYGKDAFIYEIRKTFTSSYVARLWEQKVLRRMKVTSRKDFINRTSSGFPNKGEFIWITKEQESKFVDKLSLVDYLESGWSLGRKFSSTTKAKISETRKQQHIVNIPNHSIEQRTKWSEDRKGRINGRDTSKSVIIDNIQYRTIREACKATHMTRYQIIKKYL